MNRTYRKILRNRKQRIERRLQPKNWQDRPRPMLEASNIRYQMAERTAAMNCGGIGAMHLMVQRLGLVEDINNNLQLLKVHLPYGSRVYPPLTCSRQTIERSYFPKATHEVNPNAIELV